MENDTEEKIAKLQKKIVVTSIYEAPGAVLLGLGVYAKFAANGNAFISILNNQTVVNTMLIIGIAIMLWGATTVFGLLRQIAELQKEHNI
jgi:fumarate reductase subunit C